MNPTAQQVRSWYVYVHGNLAIHIRNEPGTISYSVPRPADMPWPQHPTMHVAFTDLEVEEKTAPLIDECKTAEEFVEKLRAAGYEVTEYQRNVQP